MQLNVDGAIAVSFVDLLRNSGAFSAEEAAEYIQIGVVRCSLCQQNEAALMTLQLNGLFVLGRSLGFAAHHFDQKRLRQPLYRAANEDVHIPAFEAPRVVIEPRAT